MSDDGSIGGKALKDKSQEHVISVQLDRRQDARRLGVCPICSHVGEVGKPCEKCCDRNHMYLDTKTEIGICERCRTFGTVGVSCVLCEDSGMVYGRLSEEEKLDNMDNLNNDNEEVALSSRLKLIDEEGVGICFRCKEVGPFGNECQNKCLDDNHQVIVYDVFSFVMKRDEGICPFCKHVGISGDMCEECGRWWYTRPKESLNGEYMAT